MPTPTRAARLGRTVAAPATPVVAWLAVPGLLLALLAASGPTAAAATPTLSVTALPVPDARVPRGASLETVAAFEVAAHGGSVAVRQVAVRATGSGNAVLEVAAVYLARDDNDDGYFRTGDDATVGYDIFTAAGGSSTPATATLSAGPLLLYAGQSQRLFVVLDLQPWSVAGATYGVEVAAIATSSMALVQGLPVAGGTLTATDAAHLRLAGPLPVGMADVPRGASDVPVTEVQAWARGHAMALRSLTFAVDGSGEPATGIAAVEVWLDYDGSWTFNRHADVRLGHASFAAGHSAVTVALHDPGVNGPPWLLANQPRWLFVRLYLTQAVADGDTFALRLVDAHVEFAEASGLPITAPPLRVVAPASPPSSGGSGGSGSGSGAVGGGANGGGSSSRSATLICGAPPRPHAAGLVLVLLPVGLALALAVVRRRRRRRRRAGCRGV